MTAKNADGHRQVEGGAFLLHVRGREVYRDSLIRRTESIVTNGGARAAAGFANGGIRQTDDVELAVPSCRNVGFNIDKIRFDAVNGSAPGFEKHWQICERKIAKGEASLVGGLSQFKCVHSRPTRTSSAAA